MLASISPKKDVFMERPESCASDGDFTGNVEGTTTGHVDTWRHGYGPGQNRAGTPEVPGELRFFVA
jgi:hypothetical protein